MNKFDRLKLNSVLRTLKLDLGPFEINENSSTVSKRFQIKP